MAFVRCYTGQDGSVNTFEDMDLAPASDIWRGQSRQAASSITFTRSPNGRFRRLATSAAPT